MQELKFTKMEGAANDYVFLDALSEPGLPVPSPDAIRMISDRHRGVGGDGLVVIGPSSRAAARMRMWNADGTESDMCGNALRCIGLFVFQRSGAREFVLESESGLHPTEILSVGDDRESALVRVDMGAPRFNREEIPYKGRSDAHPLIDIPIDTPDGAVRATVLSMGNPHCVVFVEDADAVDVIALGSVLESHPDFPERANVEFVSVEDDCLYQRTYERGSGETLACGSGACAVAVAARLKGLVNGPVSIRLRGGRLDLDWQGDLSNPGTVYMAGPARISFRGELKIETPANSTRA